MLELRERQFLMAQSYHVHILCLKWLCKNLNGWTSLDCFLFSNNISPQGSLVSWADVECTLTSWLNEIIKEVNNCVKNNPVSSTDESSLRVEGVLSSMDLSSSDTQRSRRWECALPLVDDIYQDISDGQCLAAIFAFYFPHLLSPHG